MQALYSIFHTLENKKYREISRQISKFTADRPWPTPTFDIDFAFNCSKFSADSQQYLYQIFQGDFCLRLMGFLRFHLYNSPLTARLDSRYRENSFGLLRMFWF